MDFIGLLRNLSGGKPVGIKLCVGNVAEFEAVVDEMVASGAGPDFITIDGSEGGTGAAPPELSDYVGLPLREALAVVHRALVERGVRDRVTVIGAGKVATGFDMIRCLALGADACYSARAMMLAMGCIQARRCHHNDCPVGIATQDPGRSTALVVAHKAPRIARFHQETVDAFLELVGAAGCTDAAQIGPHHVHRRVDRTMFKSFAEIYGDPRPPATGSPATHRAASQPAPVPAV